MDIYSYEIGILVPVSDSGVLPDVTGFDVEAIDGHIGHVDEATYEQSASCLVVDTGFWIFGKKRMIPARAVQRVEVEDKKVYVNMTKEQIKGAADFDADRRRIDEKGYHKEVADYYESHLK